MKWVLNASRIGCWDFAAIAALAGEAGYDGVELGASADDSQFTSTNVLLGDLTKVRAIFDAAGVGIVALSSPMAIDSAADSFVEQMTSILDAAGRLGARIVRIRHQGPAQPRRGVRALFRRRSEVPSEQLIRAGDVAADRNVRIVVENAATAASAEQIWGLLERLGHPSLGCCLNLLNATLAGQSPYQTVPTLNQKTLYAQVADARIEGARMAYCKLGEGRVPVRDFLTRMLGIGYGGYVALELREDAAAEEIARDGISRLREWTQPRGPAAPRGRRTKTGAR